ncbi:hypothetical protein C8J55DRAFT_416949 [Lentinula edodes]|uniref:DUF6830 domain-containing protein n=1 Tax=Lentinula lateritia TaxID=40482 RepID=A0A9W9AZE9_9AGAR|nr:hypothetical protein C8J55DRAFT_416949 [Lentinula edodes]
MDVDSGEATLGPCTIYFPGAGKVVSCGATYLDDFNDDRFSEERKENLYYPFSSRPEWEMASFLLNSSLSMQEIDNYLQLELTKQNNLSFKTAQRLHEITDLLPPVPKWRARVMKTPPLYPSRTPVVLYYRNAVEVLQDLMKSPLICDSLNFAPLQIFEDSRKLVRVYDSWLSGNRAWQMQSQLPEGATLLGTILSSDKTTVSVITGNRVAHPLLISLANIDSDLLSKASLYLFNLLALLPVPKYIERKTSVRGVLENRLYHECLDIVLEPLKTAASIGCLMSDPVGQVRVCYTPLATRNIFPQDLPAYQRASVIARTNGVVSPFWRDWPLAEPCEFLTPEPLHHWHKMFWDHDAKWAIQAVGASHIDFRFSIHQPIVGYRSFKEGISSLKQVTGRAQRDVQRYLIPLISGAVIPKFVAALRALMDFRYAGQAPRFNQASTLRVQTALNEFHENKDIIQDLKARVNPKGVPIVHWEIPKLEFMQSVAPSISASGPIMQWTADTTEHAHITLVKDPARSGNNHDFEVQICRHLDRQSRVRRFDLVTAMVDAGVDFRLDDIEGDEGRGDIGHDREERDERDEEDKEVDAKISSSEELMTRLHPVSQKLFGSFRPKQNFFLKARLLKQDASALLPLRIFTDNISGEISAFKVNRDPDLKTLTIEQVSNLYSLPDFSGACLDFLERIQAKTQTFVIGGRRSLNQSISLPFTRVKVWSRIRIQTKTYFNTDLLADSHTIFAAPPSPGWEFGRQNAAVVNINSSFEWPRSSLEGHCVVLVKIIFTVAQPRKPSPPVDGTHRFLAYCERLDVVNQPPPPLEYRSLPGYNAWPSHFPDYSSGCFILKRARRADGTPFGDIIPVSQFRSLVDICPRYRSTPHASLTRSSSQYHSDEFFLNKYFNKELFFTLDKVDPCLTSTVK